MLIKSVKNKKARIVFIYITEGYFGATQSNYDWLESLSTKYNFDKEDENVLMSVSL